MMPLRHLLFKTNMCSDCLLPNSVLAAETDWFAGDLGLLPGWLADCLEDL